MFNYRKGEFKALERSSSDYNFEIVFKLVIDPVFDDGRD